MRQIRSSFGCYCIYHGIIHLETNQLLTSCCSTAKVQHYKIYLETTVKIKIANFYYSC